MIHKRFNFIVNLILLLSTFVMAAQQTAYEADVVNKKGVIYLEGEPFTGWLLSDESGVPNKCDCTLKAQYKKGKLHGKKTEWYKSGVLKYSGTYARGYKYGTHMYYYPNGNTKLKVVYKKGIVHKIYYRQDGTRKKYEKWKKGNIIFSKRCTSDMVDCISLFSSDEDEETEEVEEKEPGAKIILMTTDDEVIEPQDLYDGRLVILFPNRTPKRVINYESGYKVSDSVFYKNTNPQLVKLFESGELVHQEAFNEEGNKIEESHYLNGQKNGLQRLYYDNDIIKQEENYTNGELTQRIKYYESGTVESIENFVNGKKDGKQTKYDKNGAPISYEKYQNGIKKSQTFLENGKFVKDILYYDNGNAKKIIYYNNSIKRIREESFDINNKLIEEIIISPETGFPLTSTTYNDDEIIVLTYQNGSKDEEKAYKNDKLIRKGKYFKGKKEGIWIYYAEDGQSEVRKKYKDGEVISEESIYYPRLIKNRINDPYTKIVKYETQEIGSKPKYYLVQIKYSDKNDTDNTIEDQIANVLFSQFNDHYKLMDENEVNSIADNSTMISGEVIFYDTRYRFTLKKSNSNKVKFGMAINIKFFDYDKMDKIHKLVKQLFFPDQRKFGFSKREKAVTRVLKLLEKEENEVKKFISAMCFPKQTNLLKVVDASKTEVRLVSSKFSKEYVKKDKIFYISDKNNPSNFAVLYLKYFVDNYALLSVKKGGKWLKQYLQKDKHPVITQRNNNLTSN